MAGKRLDLLYFGYETRGSHKPVAAARNRPEKARRRTAIFVRRGEAGSDSDVDLFFDYQKGRLGLFELMEVKDYAATLLGTKSDIMTRDSLHEMLRPEIEAFAIRVF